MSEPGLGRVSCDAQVVRPAPDCVVKVGVVYAADDPARRAVRVVRATYADFRPDDPAWLAERVPPGAAVEWFDPRDPALEARIAGCG